VNTPVSKVFTSDKFIIECESNYLT